MRFRQVSSKRFALWVIVPAVVSVATLVLLFMLAREFSFPVMSIASVNETNTQNLRTENTELQQRVSQGLPPCKQCFDGKELSPSNDIVKYSWNFGDGEIAEGQHVSHVFNLPGIYSVTLLTKTTTGAIETQEVVVNIEATCGRRPHNIK